jgi:hypothetical protein
MAGDQRNFAWYRYTDDGGRNWAIRAEVTWAANTASGLAAFNSADQPVGPRSRLHRPRRAVYMHPTTFRTAGGPVGTAAAFAALPATITVPVAGVATAPTFNLQARIPEKFQIPGPSRHLSDIP